MKNLMYASVLALLPAMAMADYRKDAIDALGWNDDAEVASVVVSFAKSFADRGMLCGRAMTDAACTRVKDLYLEAVAREPLVVRDNAIGLLLKDGQEAGQLARLQTLMAEQPRASFEQPLCATRPLDRRCKILFDTMMLGGASQQFLDAARRETARTVKPFYTDGRPFED